MDHNQIENVYQTLIGIMNEECCVAGVENLFIDGGECDCAYAQMLEAYARLRNRLGVENEDTDVEIMISSLMKIERLVAIKMFEYGRKMQEFVR